MLVAIRPPGIPMFFGILHTPRPKVGGYVITLVIVASFLRIQLYRVVPQRDGTAVLDALFISFQLVDDIMLACIR